MFAKPEFYGSVTVGERGQIVIPSKVRENLNISSGDKLLIFSGPTAYGMMVMKSDIVSDMISNMTKDFQKIMESAEEEE